MRFLTLVLISLLSLNSWATCPNFTGKFQSELNKDKQYTVAEFRQNGCSSINYVSRTFDSSGKQLQKYKGTMVTNGKVTDQNGILVSYELSETSLTTILKYSMNLELCTKNPDNTQSCKWQERVFVVTDVTTIDPSTKGLIQNAASGFEDEAERKVEVLHYKRLK